MLFEEHSVRAFHTVWSWISFEVRIPVWGVFMLVGLTVGLSKCDFRESKTIDQPQQIPETELTDFQLLILQVFADLDGGEIACDRLTGMINSKQLLVEQALRELIDQGLIYDSLNYVCLLYTSPSPRDQRGSRMPSSA